MKQKIRYDFGIARLEIEGLPDKSLNQNETEIDIILSWSLKLIGFPELEGNKDHLLSFVLLIAQYSRNFISGIKVPLTSSNKLISIIPLDKKHKFVLTSTKKEVQSLEIILDDAELLDLTKCIDQFRLDPRVFNHKNISNELPLKRRELKLNRRILRSFLFPCLGGVTFALSSFLLLSIPLDDVNKNSPENVIIESSPK